MKLLHLAFVALICFVSAAYAGSVDDRNPVFNQPGVGVVVGAPTGGNLGNGTVNATGIYINGQAVGGGLSVPNSCVIGGTGTALSAVTLGSNLSCTSGTLNATGGGGTVTAFSVVPANGFSGSVATATTTPALTITITPSGILKGAGGALVAATAGTDYLAPSGSGAALTGLTWSQIGSTPTTPTGYGLTIPTGILKGASNGFSVATSGTDYLAPTGSGAGLTGITLPQVGGTLQASQVPAFTGDMTTTAGSLVTSVTKTGGVAFVASATTDTTNAANIGSGTLPSARLAGALPFNSDWNMVGDSHANIFAQYTPTILITGTGNTNGTTTVSNVVLSAQPQPGAGVWGASFGTFNTWIAPGGVSGNCLSSCTLTLTAVATATATGTAVNVQTYGSGNLNQGIQNNNQLGWFDALCGGCVTWRPQSGYAGNGSGIIEVLAIAGGTGYSASSVWTAANPAVALSGNYYPASNVTCTAVGGVISSCAPPTYQGIGYTTTNSGIFTCSTGCGSGASLFPITGGSGTFGAPGDTTAGMIQRIPDVCNASGGPPANAALEIGTNDIYAGIATSTIETNISTIVAGLQACNVRVFINLDYERGTWSTANVQWQQALTRVNNYIRALARQAAALNPGKPGLVVVDSNRFTTNATATGTSAGFVLSGYTVDNIHHSNVGGFFDGAALYLAAKSWAAPLITTYAGQDQIWNATNNLTGNLLGTYGLFLGTTGSNSSSCTSSSGLATGWAFSRTSGTATTQTCALTLVADTGSTTGRTDQVLTFTNISGGGASEVYRMSTQIPYANIAAGQTLVASCEMELSGDAYVNNLGIDLAEVSTTYGLSYTDNDFGLSNFPAGTAGAGLPSAATRALIPELRGIPAINQSTGTMHLLVRTLAPLYVQTGGSYLDLFIYIGFDTSSSQVGTATLAVHNCEVHRTDTF